MNGIKPGSSVDSSEKCITTQFTSSNISVKNSNVTPLSINSSSSGSTASSSSSSSSTHAESGNVGPDKPPIAPGESTAGRQYRDQPASSASPPTRDKLRAEDKARRRMNQQNDQRNAATTSVDSTEKLGQYLQLNLHLRPPRTFFFFFHSI